MNTFKCKHCWKEILPCKNHDVAKWQLADENVSGFLRWTCMLAPQKIRYQPHQRTGYRNKNKGAIVVGLHEPDKWAIKDSLVELYSVTEATTQDH